MSAEFAAMRISTAIVLSGIARLAVLPDLPDRLPYGVHYPSGTASCSGDRT